MPVFYQCQRCTACCRWPGEVRLREEEVPRMAEALGIEPEAFIQRYTRLNANRSGLALGDKENGECVLLEGGACLVQRVKPQQCRDFPNFWRFPGFERDCRAIALNVTLEDYKKLIFEATGRAVEAEPQD